MTEEYDEGSQIPKQVVDDAKNERKLQELIGVHYKRAFKECFPDYPDNGAGS